LIAVGSARTAPIAPGWVCSGSGEPDGLGEADGVVPPPAATDVGDVVEPQPATAAATMTRAASCLFMSLRRAGADTGSL
jgi:hypothetical protein